LAGRLCLVGSRRWARRPLRCHRALRRRLVRGARDRRRRVAVSRADTARWRARSHRVRGRPARVAARGDGAQRAATPLTRAEAVMDVRDVTRHRGEGFRVLEQTDRSQTAVMTISPGEDAGPEETRRADQIIYIVEGDDPVRRASSRPQPGRAPLFFVTIYAPP